MNTTTPLSSCKVNIIFWTMLILFPIVGMGVDLISPSLPAIAGALHLSTTFAKNLVATYLLGYALGSCLCGILAESIGRRRIMLISLTVFMIASLLPIIYTNTSVMLLTRLLQGLTIAGFSIVARVIAADILDKAAFIKRGTLFALTWGLGPVIGPVIGSHLQLYFDWQANFYFYSGYAGLGLLTLFFILPETITTKHPLHLGSIAKKFAFIFSHRSFWGKVSLMGTTYMLVLLFGVVGPFLIQQRLGYSVIVFGQLALLSGIAFVAANLLLKAISSKISYKNLILVKLIIGSSITLIALILNHLYPDRLATIILIICTMAIVSAIIYPSSMVRAVVQFDGLSGFASSAMNLATVLLTTLLSFFIGFVTVNNVMILVMTYGAVLVLTWLAFLILKPHR